MCIQLRSNISPLVEAKQKDTVIVEPKQKKEIKSDKVAPKVAVR